MDDKNNTFLFQGNTNLQNHAPGPDFLTAELKNINTKNTADFK